MNRLSKIILLSCLAALFVAAAASAQNSLFDNPNYRRSLELQRMAKSAFDGGDYAASTEYARQADALALQARQEAELQYQKWLANSWKNRASARIDYGKKVDAATRYPAEWAEAQTAFALAKAEFDADRYETSIEASKRVVTALAGLAAPAPAAVLPAFYRVRLIVSARDCFWRIAEYPFIYGDPTQWRLIYEANKDKLTQPENPDLIHPDLVLAIPARAGEKRSGTWSE